MSYGKGRLYRGILALAGLISVITVGCGTDQISSVSEPSVLIGQGHQTLGCQIPHDLHPINSGRIYDPGSSNYVFRTFVSRDRQIVPYREGSSRFGWVRVVGGHGVSTSLVGLTVEKGSFESSSTHAVDVYVAWFYDPTLPLNDPYRDATIRVIVSPAPMHDGLSKGIVSADANHDIGPAPNWIRSPQPTNCAWGGPGSAP